MTCIDALLSDHSSMQRTSPRMADIGIMTADPEQLERELDHFRAPAQSMRDGSRGMNVTAAHVVAPTLPVRRGPAPCSAGFDVFERVVLEFVEASANFDHRRRWAYSLRQSVERLIPSSSAA